MNQHTTQQRENDADLGLLALVNGPFAVRFATINQAAGLRPAFTPAALRDLKFKAHDRQNSRGETIKGNGTGPAGIWIQIGAKVLIDLDALDRWIESHRLGGAT